MSISMASTSCNHETNALQSICNKTNEAQQERQEETAHPLFQESDKNDASSPTLDSFLNAQESAAVHKIKKLMIPQFHLIYNHLHKKTIIKL